MELRGPQDLHRDGPASTARSWAAFAAKYPAVNRSQPMIETTTMRCTPDAMPKSCRLRAERVKNFVASGSADGPPAAASITHVDAGERLGQALAGDDVDAQGTRHRHDLDASLLQHGHDVAADSSRRTRDGDLLRCVHCYLLGLG